MEKITTTIHAGTEWEKREEWDANFRTGQNEEEQLTIITCPGFQVAADKAALYTYDWKSCRNCSVKAQVVQPLDQIRIENICPKV